MRATENYPIYYARSENQNGQKQTVSDHLSNVRKLCALYLSPLGCPEAGDIIGALHDFGKYSTKFNEVLNHQRTHINHSFPGAAMLCQSYGKKSGYELLAAAIASHHGTITSFNTESVSKCMLGSGSGFDENGNEYSLFGVAEYQNAFHLFQKEIFARQPLTGRFSLPISADQLLSRDRLDRMLCVRMLLSALVDADYTDAASHSDESYISNHEDLPLNAAEALERLSDLRIEKQKHSTANGDINHLRDKLFDDCLNAGMMEPGIYTLTAPTGLGKTLALLAFALKHCAVHRQMKRIILLLPFLAIAKQNVTDYKRIFPDLLESHSAAKCTEHTRMLSERWSASCIVTTNVGFFEPLFADSAPNVRRLHQIANSVIVLDEAQSLPPALLDATLKTIIGLCRNYGCTFLFSTATQPDFSCRPALRNLWSPTEIVSEPQQFYLATRRVTYEWHTETEIPLEQLAADAAELPTVGIIVNLRKHASRLYDLIASRRNQNEIFLLSSDLCQAHREAVIEEVKERLSSSLPVVLVSTQCIEAGVDMDFPVIYRALAPLESIIQAAGRCNRNGALGEPGKVIVFIPEEKNKYPRGDYYQYAANCVLTLLSRHPIDCSDLSHIKEYYELLYHDSNDKIALTNCISSEDYEGTAREYKMIDNRGVQIIVPWKGNEAYMELFKAVRDSYDREGLTSRLLAQARPITVTSFDTRYVKGNCQSMYFHAWDTDNGKEQAQWFLLGNPELYHPKKGFAPEDENYSLII